MQKNKTMNLQKLPGYVWFATGILLLLIQTSLVSADEPAITDLNFASLAGGKLQIQIGMNGSAITPKVFQTVNPARIALDFFGVKSALSQKRYAINQGAASTAFVVSVSGRTRVVINLTEAVPFETKVEGNKVYVILKPASAISSKSAPSSVTRVKKVDRLVSNLLPEQSINNIDFRRGSKGQGRLLIELSEPNTVVDMKKKGRKIVLNFLNTRLPKALMKSFDVIDFATPVQKFDVQSRGAGVTITITPNDGNFDYSSYQSDGLLTVEFMPLTSAEKEALLKQKTTYIGDKLSLNFQNIEVRSVLQILADFTDLNIIAADSVGGTVTLRLNDVPWDQALDFILKSNGLAKRKTGNVIFIAPLAEIIKIEEEELAAKKVVEQLEPLITEYIQINYAKAEDIQVLLTGSNVVRSSSDSDSSRTQSNILGGRLGTNSTSSRNSATERSETQGVLSFRGSSSVDSRTNTIIVKDTARQLGEIRKMIRILDVPVRQVMIEARIVIADTNFAQEIGIKFGVAKAGNIGDEGTLFGIGSGATSGLPVGRVTVDPITGIETVARDGGGTFATSVTVGAGGSRELLVDLAASAINNHPVGALGLTLARGADYVLNLELSALENENRGETLANPRVMTSDRELAFIKQGVQIPFTTVSQDGTQTELIDAVLELNVTPQITPDGDVIMELLIKRDAPNLAGGIDKREIGTIVRVKDGETIVLGGVYEGDNAKETFKIPFFGDLPGIGFLFRKNTQGERKQELLIFVTPKIIKDTLSVR